MDSSRQLGSRPLRLTAQQPSLKPPASQKGPRPALADVSNRDDTCVRRAPSHQFVPPAKAHAKASAPPPMPAPPAPVSLPAPSAAPALPTTLAASTRAILPVRRAGAMGAPPPGPMPVPPRSAGRPVPSVAALSLGAVQDMSMSTDGSHIAAEPDADASLSSPGVRSDESDLLADIELDLDPAGLVTVSLEEELVEQRRVAEVCERFEASVLAPQALAAQAERQELVRLGQMDPDAAAHDDTMMRLGLDTEEARDLSMVAEYAQDIFAYMGCCERESMANPNYMDFQDEIQWHMRATLIDWLLQVHTRYHMLPETLWIAVNLVDRFLSARIVSLAKLQLVGVTAMFIAAKYEEILAPSVEEFVFMTDGGYSREEILKGERIVLSTLDFNVSTYCSPYSWVRRISKADDYDIQTRTLCKCLMEITLFHYLFLRVRPSMIAAIGMYLAKRMLGGVWDDAFVYYARFTEAQLLPGANLLLEKLLEPGFEDQFVYKKYASKKFLKASIYARHWALRHPTLTSASADAVPGASRASP
ncbi:B-type cyclin [Malassezia caprae]|uniref:B-type cyclin n=1 Tax=Malassezia caprae TaxID=1381934 RepID=A0AAF0EBF4_9BASI|nr:B-type cyclin [Malassezia caprae]